jgi:ABC-type cobalt transport system substrate-binding protein
LRQKLLRLAVLALAIALVFCSAATVWASVDEDGAEPETELILDGEEGEDEPAEEPIEEYDSVYEPAEGETLALPEEQEEEPPETERPETMPSLAPSVVAGSNPDTGEAPLFAAAAAAGVCAIAVLIVAGRKRGKNP